jgi:hypothetical protein
MNTYVQLIRDSIVAPRAAVDLAKQHPNPYQLGWQLVGLTIVWDIFCDIGMRHFLRPLLKSQKHPDVVTDGANVYWIDTTLGTAVFAALSYPIIFLLLRAFWRKMAEKDVSQQAVDSAVTTGFACTVALLLPQYLLMEVTENVGIPAIVLGWIVPVAVSIYLSTVYFSHSLAISMGRSFWLNVLSICMLITVSLVLLVFGLLIYAALFGVESVFFRI